MKKLTEEQVQDIRKSLVLLKENSISALCKKYGVSQSTIWRVGKRTTAQRIWKDTAPTTPIKEAPVKEAPTEELHPYKFDFTKDSELKRYEEKMNKKDTAVETGQADSDECSDQEEGWRRAAERQEAYHQAMLKRGKR